MEYLTPKDVCSRLGISRFKLNELVKRGLPCYVIGPRTRRFVGTEVDRWLERFSPVPSGKDMD